MSDKLLPCPFCGGEAEIREIFVTGFHNALFIAKCRNIGCGAIGSECVKKETAIEKWNKRTSPWHTGTPTEEGWYLLKVKSDDEIIYDTNRLIQCLWGLDWKYVHEEILEWQKIDGEKEKNNG